MVETNNLSQRVWNSMTSFVNVPSTSSTWHLFYFIGTGSRLEDSSIIEPASVDSPCIWIRLCGRRWCDSCCGNMCNGRASWSCMHRQEQLQEYCQRKTKSNEIHCIYFYFHFLEFRLFMRSSRCHIFGCSEFGGYEIRVRVWVPRSEVELLVLVVLVRWTGERTISRRNLFFLELTRHLLSREVL
jgi:hypothetical protein